MRDEQQIRITKTFKLNKYQVVLEIVETLEV